MSPTQQQFEQTLAWHCAPALTGIKPADLVSWAPPSQDGFTLLGYYAGALVRRGIRLRVVGYKNDRILLLVFRPHLLEECLSQSEVRNMLRPLGYPVNQGMEAMLGYLRTRLLLPQFPHEIGLFLGYPPADVEGFCTDGGRGCKLSGTWKVYDNVEQARQTFARFQSCRIALTRRLEQGHCLEQVFPTA